MFQSSLKRVRLWVERTLAPIEHPPETANAQLIAADEQSAAPPARHPHRRELRWERDRRPGSIPPPPAHCISPVRPQSGARTHHGTPR